jgi:hypothetical protein
MKMCGEQKTASLKIIRWVILLKITPWIW